MGITPVHVFGDRGGDCAVIKDVNYGNAVLLQLIDVNVTTSTVKG